GAVRRRPARPRRGRRPPESPGIRPLARRGTPAAPTCRPRSRRGSPGPGSARPERLRAAGRAADTRCAGRATCTDITWAGPRDSRMRTPHGRHETARVTLVESAQTVTGPGRVPVPLHINGRQHVVELEPRVSLLDALREHLDLTGSKKGCD